MNRPDNNGRPRVPGLDEPVFAEPWQAEAFAMVVALHERGLFSWAEWADALSAEVKRDSAAPDGSDYYEHWLKALERLLAAKGIAGPAEIDALSDAWQRAAHATPHGKPILLENDPEGARRAAVKRTIAAPVFAHYPSQWHLSPVLDTGDFAFLSGQTGCRPDGTVASDPEEQFREAFEFLKVNLAAAALTFDDVVEMTTYHVDLRRHLPSFTKVKDEYVFAPYPAWTAIGVTEFITEGTLVEIRIIAKCR